MTILQANIEHLSILAPLFNGYRVFYKQQSDIEATKPFLRERLTKKDTLIYIAFINDKAVGFTHVFHSFSSVSMEPLYILNDLYVDKNYRKRGVGVALLNTVKKLCKTTNYKGIALQTETTNPAL